MHRELDQTVIIIRYVLSKQLANNTPLVRIIIKIINIIVIKVLRLFDSFSITIGL